MLDAMVPVDFCILNRRICVSGDRKVMPQTRANPSPFLFH